MNPAPQAPSAERRTSSVEKVRLASRRSTPDARRSGRDRSGMTLIELGIVMGIVAVLLALVLGLSRHVNEAVNIRRAQAELGEWHETFSAWFLKFGEYPYAVIDTAADSVDDTLLHEESPTQNLSNLLARCAVRIHAAGSDTNFFFRAFHTSHASHIDPWGTPYVYDCGPDRRSYTLYSCGPDSRTRRRDGAAFPAGAPETPDPTLDDILFER